MAILNDSNVFGTKNSGITRDCHVARLRLLEASRQRQFRAETEAAVNTEILKKRHQENRARTTKPRLKVGKRRQPTHYFPYKLEQRERRESQPKPEPEPEPKPRKRYNVTGIITEQPWRNRDDGAALVKYEPVLTDFSKSADSAALMTQDRAVNAAFDMQSSLFSPFDFAIIVERQGRR